MTKTNRTTPHFWTKREIKENRIQDDIRSREIALEVKRKKRRSLNEKQAIERIEAKKTKRTSQSRTTGGVPAGSVSYQSRPGGRAGVRKSKTGWKLAP